MKASEMLTQAELEKVHAEIAKLMAETSKINAEARWYPVVVAGALIGAAVAATKIFLA